MNHKISICIRISVVKFDLFILELKSNGLLVLRIGYQEIEYMVYLRTRNMRKWTESQEMCASDDIAAFFFSSKCTLNRKWWIVIYINMYKKKRQLTNQGYTFLILVVVFFNSHKKALVAFWLPLLRFEVSTNARVKWSIERILFLN